MIDRRPAAIARCATVTDVATCVEFARTADMVVAIRGGGHNIAGNAVCDEGLVIDLSLMKQISVDPARRTVRAGGGVVWGELDAATQRHDLATTGGLMSRTGIAGFTLGGGLGNLMRSYGLACDNLLSAEVVTADGRELLVSRVENSDLFWALRGGGGNFGVVTSLEFQLHPVGPVLLAGGLAHPLSAARDTLRFYRECTVSAADALIVYANLGRGRGLSVQSAQRMLSSSTQTSAAAPTAPHGRACGRPSMDPLPRVRRQSANCAASARRWLMRSARAPT